MCSQQQSSFCLCATKGRFRQVWPRSVCWQSVKETDSSNWFCSSSSPRSIKIHIRSRQEFAKKLVEDSMVKWKKILWSDESKIELLAIRQGVIFGGNQTLHITKNTPSPLWSMVVVASCFGDVSQQLAKIEGRMNAANYTKILGDNLIQSARKLRLGRRFIFQQDNDPKHTAKATQEWLKKNQVNVLEWPSQSPDLNPIEILWLDLKRAVHAWYPHNLTELEQFCKEEWSKIAVGRCTRLIETLHTESLLWLQPKVHLQNWPEGGE